MRANGQWLTHRSQPIPSPVHLVVGCILHRGPGYLVNVREDADLLPDDFNVLGGCRDIEVDSDSVTPATGRRRTQCTLGGCTLSRGSSRRYPAAGPRPQDRERPPRWPGWHSRHPRNRCVGRLKYVAWLTVFHTTARESSVLSTTYRLRGGECGRPFRSDLQGGHGSNGPIELRSRPTPPPSEPRRRQSRPSSQSFVPSFLRRWHHGALDGVWRPSSVEPQQAAERSTQIPQL